MWPPRHLTCPFSMWNQKASGYAPLAFANTPPRLRGIAVCLYQLALLRVIPAFAGYSLPATMKFISNLYYVVKSGELFSSVSNASRGAMMLSHEKLSQGTRSHLDG